MEIGDNLWELVLSLFLPMWPSGVDSDRQAGQQVPLHMEPSATLCNDLLRVIVTPMCSVCVCVDVGTCVWYACR